MLAVVALSGSMAVSQAALAADQTLRVGIMSAKTLAYATGCALLAIDTFEAIRLAMLPNHRRLI